MEKKPDILTFHSPDLTTRQELPVAGGDVKAGFPSPADDFLDAPLDLNRELVHNPASTFFCTGFGRQHGRRWDWRRRPARR